MCCIFTCCGWIVDLLQRVWVFLMSCVIGSAVCCVLITSSMSGVALGYNYSLAEYIETKETNVSVYLKRGVFDDEVSQDMEWRRRGHKSLNPLLKDDGDLKTGAPDAGPDEIPFRRSNRRLEDSILDSNDKNNFEGSLMKLTVKPPYSETTRTFHTNDLEMLKVHSTYTPGSLDELKGIQGLINKRKMKSGRDSTVTAPNNHGEVDLAYYPGERRPGGRRMMGPGIENPTPGEPSIALMRDENSLPRINPARYAVPDASIGSPGNWFMPKIKPEVYRKLFDSPEADPPPYPQPVTIRPSTIRPPRPTSIMPQLTYQSTPPLRTLDPALFTGDMDVEKFRQRNEEFLKRRPGIKQPGAGSDAEYYEDDIKGIPVRKRRSINHVRFNKPQVKDTVTKSSEILNYYEFSQINSADKDKQKYIILKPEENIASKLTLKEENFLSTQILNQAKLSVSNPLNKDKQISTLKPQSKVASAENLQELIHEQTKFRVEKSISDAIKYYLSISLDKLNLFNQVQSSVTNENINKTRAGNKTYISNGKLSTVFKMSI